MNHDAAQSKYCTHCNFPVNKILIAAARFDYPCPNCKLQTISNFYSYGSTTHKWQWIRYSDYRKAGVWFSSGLHCMPPKYEEKNGAEL